MKIDDRAWATKFRRDGHEGTWVFSRGFGLWGKVTDAYRNVETDEEVWDMHDEFYGIDNEENKKAGRCNLKPIDSEAIQMMLGKRSK